MPLYDLPVFGIAVYEPLRPASALPSLVRLQGRPGRERPGCPGKGLSGLTFTEHYDLHPDDWKSCVYQHGAYTHTIESLRKQYGSELFIGQGIEVCYQPSRMGVILDFLSRHEFDLVILSVHYFGTRAVHRRENWEGVDPEAGTRRYLETVLEAVRFCEDLHAKGHRVFDVLGHLDLVKRYTHRFAQQNVVDHHTPLLNQILQSCLAAELIPEINTSTLRQGLDETMPASDTVARYAAYGGLGITLGSDAHVSDDIGAGFDEAVAIMRSSGMRHLVLHRQRQREMVPLPPTATPPHPSGTS